MYALLSALYFRILKGQFFALNVEDEIAFALEWKGLNKAEIIQRVNDVIEMFSLGEIRNQAIDSLSEGQKQKVGLATVVAMQIKNIILDELQPILILSQLRS